MKKDIFIDNNIAKNFSNPMDVEYKKLILMMILFTTWFIFQASKPGLKRDRKIYLMMNELKNLATKDTKGHEEKKR